MPLSEKQMSYLALAWQCFESEPKINYEKFAEVAGLKNARSGAELMRVTKNKLEEYGALSGNAKAANAKTLNTPTKSTPKKAAGTKSASGTPAPSTGKRGRKAAGVVDGHDGDEDDEEVEKSPTKKRKESASPVKREAVEEEDEDEWA